MKPITWKNVKVPLGKLAPWVHNPREITQEQAERLGGSMEEFGQVDVFAIGPKFDVYNGHQRLGVLLVKHGPKHVVDCRQSSRVLTEKERKKLTVLLHATATGQWNWDALSAWEGMDLSEWGFNKSTLKAWKADVNALGNFLASGEGESDDPGVDVVDRAVELQVKWETETGQLWKLGNHRLLIGDCTVRENVDRLMGGKRAEFCFTDPPYGVSYTGGTKKWVMLENDDEVNMYAASLPIIHEFTTDKAALYCAFASANARSVYNSFFENGYEQRALIIWNKNHAQFGSMGSQYKQKHEPIAYCFKKGKSPHWFGANNEVTVWDIDRESKNEYHPTQKPVTLVERAMRNSSPKDCIVFEPFAGSGTTIIAAENLSRRCYAMEISPNYGAVILERWSMRTGKTPVLEGKKNGKAKTKTPQ